LKILKWFKRKKQSENIYTKMGSLGVSPAYMLMYEDSIKKINETK
jgi:hypothetical protein